MISGRVVCFGELLLRLGAPGRQVLLQEPRFEVQYGGAEANVAVSLARFGHAAAMVSVVPDNALGRACIGELRRHGVDTRDVVLGDGRMGLYFLTTGAIHRPSEVLYDRAHSAFALSAPDRFDWDAILSGASGFHLSGVTPALGPASAAAAIRAIKAARERGLTVSFDGNYRAKLWDAWRGDAPGIHRQILAHADIVFADHRDIAIALGADFGGVAPEQRNLAAARAAFDAFGQIRRMATTIRVQHNVDRHDLAATLITRDGALTTESHALSPIVDRIGAGDAFAAGVLHGLRTGMGDADALRFGLAAACLKHSIPGDFNLASTADVAAFLSEQRFDVRR